MRPPCSQRWSSLTAQTNWQSAGLCRDGVESKGPASGLSQQTPILHLFPPKVLPQAVWACNCCLPCSWPLIYPDCTRNWGLAVLCCYRLQCWGLAAIGNIGISTPFLYSNPPNAYFRHPTPQQHTPQAAGAGRVEKFPGPSSLSCWSIHCCRYIAGRKQCASGIVDRRQSPLLHLLSAKYTTSNGLPAFTSCAYLLLTGPRRTYRSSSKPASNPFGWP